MDMLSLFFFTYKSWSQPGREEDWKLLLLLVVVVLHLRGPLLLLRLLSSLRRRRRRIIFFFGVVRKVCSGISRQLFLLATRRVSRGRMKETRRDFSSFLVFFPPEQSACLCPRPSSPLNEPQVKTRVIHAFEKRKKNNCGKNYMFHCDFLDV